VRVQGEGAREEIVAALRRLNALRTTAAIDVIIVGRGGGSIEDLWPFNEECVAQAIFESRIPIVTGVGHETDLTIADLVADVRALTPSEAAEKVVPDRAAVLKWLTDLEARFQGLLVRSLKLARTRLEALANRPCFRQPLERIREEERRLEDLSSRLERALRQRLHQARQRLQAQAAHLESLSPLNVLARGYSLTMKEQERTVLRSPDQVQPGDRLVTRVAHGVIISRVEETSRPDTGVTKQD
jgi:exodeoxyribonuclease VII large subunit